MNRTPEPGPEPELTPDPELRALLRAAHPAPGLPPRFQEGVWQRLERSERPDAASGWFERWVRACFRPAYATLTLAVVMAAGAGLGVRDTAVANREREQARYVAAVNPLRQVP